MIQRYLGKKTEILQPLLAEIGLHAKTGDHVVDAFSGSLTVSFALKAAGYQVTANDANLLSYMLGRGYLTHSQIPAFKLEQGEFGIDGAAVAEARVFLNLRVAQAGYAAIRHKDAFETYCRTASLVTWLNHVASHDLPAGDRRRHFEDNYTEGGRHSEFRSLRGATGRRRFFTSDNARRLDLALNQLRVWRRAGLDDACMGFLLGTIMRGLEQVANTQGTYHDFPRARWDARAFKPLVFEPPPPDLFTGPPLCHMVGRAEDSLDFITRVDEHAVLYLDPPYNFRQYSDYYFLLNLVCRYPDIEDPDGYFKEIKFVRGQNPEDTFKSTFCSSSSFVADLSRLIQGARASTVVISYFNGRNHWSQFDSGPSDTGRELLESMLTGSMFVPGSLRVTEVDRLNYASYGGYRARKVQELILTASKRRGTESGHERSADGRLSTVA